MDASRAPVVYTGQRLPLRGCSLRTSHQKRLDDAGLTLEFELSTPAGWDHLFVTFPIGIVQALMPATAGGGEEDPRADGLYPSDRSRMLALVRGHVRDEFSEQDVARELFRHMH